MCFGSLFKGKRNSTENFEDDVFMELKSNSEDPGNYSTSPSADKLLNEVIIWDLRTARFGSVRDLDTSPAFFRVRHQVLVKLHRFDFRQNLHQSFRQKFRDFLRIKKELYHR